MAFVYKTMNHDKFTYEDRKEKTIVFLNELESFSYRALQRVFIGAILKVN